MAKKKKKKILKNFGQKKLSKIKKKIVKITVITRKSQINSEEIQQFFVYFKISVIRKFFLKIFFYLLNLNFLNKVKNNYLETF